MVLLDAKGVKDKVREIVKGIATMGQNSITDDSRLKRDLGIDSILIVDLIINIEEAFDIEVDFDSLSVDNFSSIEMISRYVEEKLANE